MEQNVLNTMRVAPKGSVEITDRWCMRGDGRPQRELAAYLTSAFGLTLAGNGPEIRMEMTEEKGFSVRVAEQGIVFSGRDEASLLKAVYTAQRQMNRAEAPFLASGSYTTRFCCRLAGNAGGNYEDGYLREVGKAGFDGICVPITDEEDDCRALVERIHGRGLLAVCKPDYALDAGPEDAAVGALIAKRTAEGFDGFLFGGGRFEFRTGDEHTCRMLENENITPAGRKSLKPSSRRYPCCDYALLMETVCAATELPVYFSTLNWADAPENARCELVRALPEQVILISSFEGGQQIKRDGTAFRTTPDTCCFPGPSAAFAAEIRAATEHGLRVMAATSLCGTTADFPVPYVPSALQTILRLEEVKANNVWGVFEPDFSPSFVGEFAAEQCLVPCEEPGVSLQKSLIWRFGAANMENMMLAIKNFSDGAALLSSYPSDIRGAFLFGPAFPLAYETKPFLTVDWNRVEAAYSHPEKGDITLETDCELKAAEKFFRGGEIVRHLAEKTEGRQQQELEALHAVAAFIADTLETAANAKKWYRRVEALKKEAEPFKRKFLTEQLVKIGKEELENCMDAAELLAAEPRLGWRADAGNVCTLETLEEKYAQTDEAIGKLSVLLS